MVNHFAPNCDDIDDYQGLYPSVLSEMWSNPGTARQIYPGEILAPLNPGNPDRIEMVGTIAIANCAHWIV